MVLNDNKALEIIIIISNIINRNGIELCFMFSKELKKTYKSREKHGFNPFLANVPILYPLETSENLWLSIVFRGYKMGTLGRNGFKVK